MKKILYTIIVLLTTIVLSSCNNYSQLSSNIYWDDEPFTKQDVVNIVQNDTIKYRLHQNKNAEIYLIDNQNNVIKVKNLTGGYDTMYIVYSIFILILVFIIGVLSKRVENLRKIYNMQSLIEKHEKSYFGLVNLLHESNDLTAYDKSMIKAEINDQDETLQRLKQNIRNSMVFNTLECNIVFNKINEAAHYAQNSEFEYFSWKNRVYTTELEDMNILATELY